MTESRKVLSFNSDISSMLCPMSWKIEMYLVFIGYCYVSEELGLERCKKGLTNFIVIINSILKFLLTLMGFYVISVK